MDANVNNAIMSKKIFNIIDNLQTFVVIAVVFCLFFSHFMMANVPSSSMEPTLIKGGSFIYHYTEPEDMDYGDNVTFFYDADKNIELNNNLDVMYKNRIVGLTPYVKRLMGKPGDVMEIKNGYMYRNGEQLYSEKEIFEEMEPYVVPENSFYCLGDNRADSYDSVYCALSIKTLFSAKKLFI